MKEIKESTDNHRKVGSVAGTCKIATGGEWTFQ